MARPKFFLQPLSAAIFIACYSGTLFAETETSVQALAPIIITAQQGNEASGLIVQADPKKPIQPVPATDGADYLQSIVGFSAIKNGGTNGDVTFRGMFGSRIKILTDGTENLGACPSRMDAPTSYIQPESYDQISVIKGPQTVQYAQTGSAATVIFERKPVRFNEDQHYQGQASAMLGSFGRLDHNVEAAVGDENKYIRLNANRSKSDSYKDGDGNTVPSAWERWNTDLALGWTPDEQTWLELTAGKSDGEALYAGRDMDGSQFARESLGLRFEKNNINDVIKKIEGQVNYSYNDHIMDNFSLRTPPLVEMTHSGMTMLMPDLQEMQVTRRTLNTRLAVTTAWNQANIISGIDSQHNHHAGGMTSMMMNMPLTTNMKFQSYGAFSELSYPFNEHYKLVTGARIDQIKIDALKLDENRKETLPSAFVRLEGQHPEHDAKTYIGLGYVQRAPDYWELFSTAHGNTGMGKPTFNDLDTEKTLQLDLGYQHQHGAFSSWLSTYTGLINDYILISYRDHPAAGAHGHGSNFSAGAKNIDAVIAGAEAGVGYQLTDAVQADLSTMYAWGKNTTDHTPLPQIAPLEGRFNLRYVEDKYTLGLLWRMVAQQDRISLNQGNIVGYDLQKSKGFSTLSLNGSYSLMQHVDLALGIDNVLNKTYTEHLNRAGSSGFGFASREQFNNMGRNYWACVSIKF